MRKQNLRPIVLSLDTRGTTESSSSALVARLRNYGKELKAQSVPESIKLVVFSGRSNFKSYSIITDSIEIFYFFKFKFDFLFFAINCYNTIKQNKFQVKLIIVADPWEGFWTGILLRIMLKSNIPIQVQFHGDFLDPNWRKINFKNRIKYCLLKINFYKFDSIRAVGERQARDLERNLKVSPKVISVNPIPITLETNANQKDHIRPRSLGFVGRIHSDRGLTKFVELVESLNSVSTDFSVVIAGAGPLTKRFIRKLNAIIPKNRLTYFGNVSYSEMSKVWRQIGVLVSTAPAEAYGMAIRESLISGVPVWATQSSGVLDLLDSAEPGTVKLLNFKKDESKLYKDFEALLKVKVGPKFRDKFIKENNLYAEKLVSSWIDTIENFKK